jgi:hypothetical protein
MKAHTVQQCDKETDQEDSQWEVVKLEVEGVLLL